MSPSKTRRPSRPRIPIAKEAAEKAGFWTKKGLGQHLLRDITVAEAAITALEPKGADLIIEIGPGLGALTESLLKLGIPVLGIEVDEAACKALKERFSGLAHFQMLQADVLETDLGAEIAKRGAKSVRIAANLPYYITTPVLAKLLEEHVPFTHMSALVQWEVGQRLAAGTGGKDRAAISILMQYHCQVQLLRKVQPGAFTPPPRVDSALMLLKRLEKPSVTAKDEKLFFGVVREAFSKRRKTLKRALLMASDSALGTRLRDGRLDQAFKDAGIDPARRAETMELEEWARLANALSTSPG